MIKTPRLDNVFVPPRLDVDDFLRRECPYYNKEECLRIFQLQQQFLDNVQPSMHLGKSEHGIYCTALRWYQLQVWVLHEASESRPVPEWELKHKADLKPTFLQHYKGGDGRKKSKASWALNCEENESEDSGEENESEDTGDRGWDSSDHSGIGVEEDGVYSNGSNWDIGRRMDFLGYHPSKEIAFLGNCFDGFAYYLGSSKLQYLGTIKPVGCCHIQVAATHESFIYTPCMDDLLPAHSKNSKDGESTRSPFIFHYYS